MLKFQIPTSCRLRRLVPALWRISDVTTKAYIAPRTPLLVSISIQHQQKSNIHYTAIPTRPRLNRHLTSSRQSPTIASFIQSLIRPFTNMSASEVKAKVQKTIDENPVGRNMLHSSADPLLGSISSKTYS